MYVLPQGVFAVRIAEEVIFLDLNRDAYLALRDPATAITLLDDAGAARVDDRELAVELEGAGLISSVGAAGARRDAEAATQGISTADLERVGGWDVIAFAVAVAWTAARHPRTPMAELVRWARRRPALRRTTTSPRRLAAAWADLMIWSPWQGDCLFRSHVLLRFLRLRGCDADWVFAVRTWPFAAHCWLQAGPTVLTDQPEVLAAFAPILVA